MAVGQGAQGASAPASAPKGITWIWQICEVCLGKTACKAQWHDGCPIPYHAHEAVSCASHPLAWAASMCLCQVHAEQLILPLPPPQEGKEASPGLRKFPPSPPSPSLPPSPHNEITGWMAIWSYRFLFGNFGIFTRSMLRHYVLLTYSLDEFNRPEVVVR